MNKSVIAKRVCPQTVIARNEAISSLWLRGSFTHDLSESVRPGDCFAKDARNDRLRPEIALLEGFRETDLIGCLKDKVISE